MASQPTTLLDELVAAGRGCLALTIGDRRAPGAFDFSLRGLYGAAIAFLVALLIQSYLPLVLGAERAAGDVTRGLVVNIFLIGAQIGATYVVLRQLKRLDALVPYLVTSGWVTFFATILLIALSLVGVNSLLLLFGIGIAFLVLEINIARLVMTLSPMQIGTLLVAQLVGVFVGLLIIGLLVPLPPELAAEVAAGMAQ